MDHRYVRISNNNDNSSKLAPLSLERMALYTCIAVAEYNQRKRASFCRIMAYLSVVPSLTGKEDAECNAE